MGKYSNVDECISLNPLNHNFPFFLFSVSNGISQSILKLLNDAIFILIMAVISNKEK